MSLVREILRSDLDDLTVVSYGGPDVGLLCAAGKVRKVVFGFVSLDSIPLDPHFRAARQGGRVEVAEYDEGMLQWGLYAAGIRLPYLPTRAGLGSERHACQPELRTVTDPYGDETLVAIAGDPARRGAGAHEPSRLHGNAQYLGPDLYFDDLFCMAAEQGVRSRANASCRPPNITRRRASVDDTRFPACWCPAWWPPPGGAHFTSLCAGLRPRRGVPAGVRHGGQWADQDPRQWQAFVDATWRSRRRESTSARCAARVRRLRHECSDAGGSGVRWRAPRRIAATAR